MKKGLITAVGTMILAIAGSSFAKAPTITGVPDVVISDAEDRLGGTQDLNFFRYVNAFNIMSYTADEDSTPGQLKWAFVEDTAQNDLEINGKTQQADAATAAPSAWANGFTGTGTSYLWSFRNLVYSPHRGTTVDPPTGPAFPDPTLNDGTIITDAGTTATNLPWHNTATTRTNALRTVTLFVADEAENKASDSINVYVQNKGADAISGTFTTLFTDVTFATASGWKFTQYAFTNFGLCTTSGGNGTALGLTAGATHSSGAYFTRCIESQEYVAPIQWVAGNIIYFAKMRLELTSSTSSLSAYAPELRIGVENGLQQLVTMNWLKSENLSNATADATYNPQLPLVGSFKDYRIFWSPMPNLPSYDAISNLSGIDWRRWRVFFEIIDSNTAGTLPQDSGQWKLTRLDVGYGARPADLPIVSGSSTAFKMTDLTGNAKSVSGGAFAVNSAFPGSNSTITQNSPAAGKITFHQNAVTTTSSSYAAWERMDTIPWMANKIVRVSAKLTCPTSADRAAFPQARIRTATLANWLAQEFIVKAVTDQGITALLGTTVPLVPAVGTDTASATTYETYVPSYGGPNSLVLSLIGALPFRSDYFTLGLDSLANPVPQTGAEAAVNWVVHEVQIEALDEPAV